MVGDASMALIRELRFGKSAKAAEALAVATLGRPTIQWYALGIAELRCEWLQGLRSADRRGAIANLA